MSNRRMQSAALHFGGPAETLDTLLLRSQVTTNRMPLTKAELEAKVLELEQQLGEAQESLAQHQLGAAEAEKKSAEAFDRELEAARKVIDSLRSKFTVDAVQRGEVVELRMRSERNYWTPTYAS